MSEEKHSSGDELLDLLDRQEFVDQMLSLAQVLSDHKKNACYAINGCWGAGKSFVLNMFENQAEKQGKEGEILPRFLVFRYNCWEYDYYEEPVVAIVASMLDQIDAKADLLPADLKTTFLSALKTVGLKVATTIFKNKTGIDLDLFADNMKDVVATAKNDVNDSHEYDYFFEFKKNLNELKEKIRTLAEAQTVLFIVDELDRCLPEYTIKVLERLHHLFEGLQNVQVILSVDVGQLEHVVKQIFGVSTDASQYLRKFINFSLLLGVGTIKDNFSARFKEYLQYFEIKEKSTDAIKVDEFKTALLEGLDMRSRISIIHRCELIHGLLNGDEKIDASYMCLELFLVLLNDYGVDISYAKGAFSLSYVFETAHKKETSEKALYSGLNYLSSRYKDSNFWKNRTRKIAEIRQDTGSKYNVVYNIVFECLEGQILCAYLAILGMEEQVYPNTNTCDDALYRKYIEYAKKYWELLQIIH